MRVWRLAHTPVRRRLSKGSRGAGVGPTTKLAIRDGVCTLAALWLALLASCTPTKPTPGAAELTETVRPPTSTPAPTPSAPTSTPIPPTVEPEVEVIRDVRYLSPLQSTVKERVLDIYSVRPGDGGVALPIVVFAHGFGQSKAALGTVSTQLAEQGAVVFVPSWPTDRTSAASWREMTEAIACAVRFARENAGSYGGDPDNLTLVGFSMGGGIGAYVALNTAELGEAWNAYEAAHDGPPPQVACVADAAVEVNGFVGIGGSYSLPDRFAETDPDLLALLSSMTARSDLKIVLMQGEFDSTVPPETTEAFRVRLAAAGYTPALVMYDSGHTIPRELTVETVMETTR